MNYQDHDDVIKGLAVAQDDDKDNRERAREAHDFVSAVDGQWEPDIAQKFINRPRYTFDQVGPVVDQITSEITQADFTIRIRPAGGETTKDDAKIYDGMIRGIESRSNAQHIYAQAAGELVEGGLSGWMVTTDYSSSDSFDQDLFIRPLNNHEDRVYWDSGAEMQDRSDAEWVIVLTEMPKSKYTSRYPDGSGASVSINRTREDFVHKPDTVTVGQIFYKKYRTKKLVKFSDGSVREGNQELDLVFDELAQQGIIAQAERDVRAPYVCSRIFDGKDWLNDEQETVFTDYLPVITVYANYKIRRGKIFYKGIVQRLIDPARVYNYVRSREIEEVALAPRAKYWMTTKQAAGHKNTLNTLNTNADPVQIYNNDPEVPGPPKQNGGASVNPGLLQASQNTIADLTTASGLFALNRGDVQDNTLSGVAIQSLQNKGDNSTIQYFQAIEIGITQTAKILVKAIPKVYDANRQVQILNEDGAEETLTVNERVFDNQTETWVTTNDLTKGVYDVTCDVGPAFKNRQQESVKAITDLITVMPELGGVSADVLLKNINSPGVDIVAQRLRQQMLDSGLIPVDQMTDEEKQLLQQKPPAEPTAEDKIAAAELQRVEAETADTISRVKDRGEKTALELARLKLQAQKQKSDADLSMMKHRLDEQERLIQANLQGQAAVLDQLKQQAETLKILREASGADAVITPGLAQAINEQSQNVAETVREY